MANPTPSNTPSREEMRILALMAEQSKVRKPQTLEELEAEELESPQGLRKLKSGSLCFDPFMLKSALFAPRTGTRKEFKEFTKIPSSGKNVIEYCGPELRQDDQRVLLMLLKLRAEKHNGHLAGCSQFAIRSFCVNVLRWADSSSSDERLKDSIVRMKSADIRVRYENFQAGYSIISAYEFKRGACTVWLSPRLASLFKFHTTFFSRSARLSIADGLASWLWTYIKAEFAPTPQLKLAELRQQSAKTEYIQKEFNREIKKAAMTLQSEGLIEKFSVVRGVMTVIRSA